MNGKLKYGLIIYLFGAAAVGTYLILEAISKGGVDRLASKGAIEVLGLTAFYLAISLLWPLLVVVGVLQYLGVLPHPLTF